MKQRSKLIRASRKDKKHPVGQDYQAKAIYMRSRRWKVLYQRREEDWKNPLITIFHNHKDHLPSRRHNLICERFDTYNNNY